MRLTKASVRYVAGLAAAVAATLALPACETTGDPDPGGSIEAEQEGILSDTADTKLKLASGETNATVKFKAGSGMADTKVKARLVAGVMKLGAKPADSRVVQILPPSLRLSTPATLVMGLDPPEAGKTYRAIHAIEGEASWTLGPPARVVPDSELNFGGATRMAYAIDVAGPGLWGIFGWDGSIGPDGGTDGPTEGPGGEGPPSNVLRTLAFHQVVTPPANPTTAPVVSADGSTIAFAIAPGTRDPMMPNKIYVVGSDGAGLREVDSYTSLCFCGSALAISGDGKTVVSTDAVQLRVVSSSGALQGSLKTVSNEIWGRPALSGDGSRVFVTMGRDNQVAGMGGMPLQRGIWTMSADGSGLKQIAGPDAIGALTGAAKPDDVFPFRICGDSVGASADGTRVALATFVNGKGDTLLGVGGDGSGLHVITGPIAPAPGSSVSLYRLSLSGDGKTVIYRGIKDPKVSSDTEVVAIGFDGTGRKKFIGAPPVQIGGGCDSVVQPTTDGTRVLVSETGTLWPVGGGEPLALYAPTASYSSDPSGIGTFGCCAGAYLSMSGNGKRFVFQNIEGPGKPIDIGTLDLDPPSIGGGPSLTAATVSPDSIPRDRSVAATVGVKVTGPGIIRVGTEVLLRGEPDGAGSYTRGQIVLLDDGKMPDSAAGDGVYAGTGLNAGSGSEVGARVVRIKVETKAADGKRHATAIDVAGLSVK